MQTIFAQGLQGSTDEQSPQICPSSLQLVPMFE